MLGKRNPEEVKEFSEMEGSLQHSCKKKGFSLDIKTATASKMLQIEYAFNRETPAVFQSKSNENDRFRVAGGYLVCGESGMYGMKLKLISELADHSKLPEADLFDDSEAPSRFQSEISRLCVKTNSTLIVYPHYHNSGDIISQILGFNPNLTVKLIGSRRAISQMTFETALQTDIFLVPDKYLDECFGEHVDEVELGDQIDCSFSHPFSKKEKKYLHKHRPLGLRDFVWKRVVVMQHFQDMAERMQRYLPGSEFIWLVCVSKSMYSNRGKIRYLDSCYKILRNYLKPNRYYWLEDGGELLNFSSFVKENLLVNFDYPLGVIDNLDVRNLYDMFDTPEQLAECLKDDTAEICVGMVDITNNDSDKLELELISRALDKLSGTKTAIITQGRATVDRIMKTIPRVRDIIVTPSRLNDDPITQCYYAMFKNTSDGIVPSAMMLESFDLTLGYQFDGISQIIFTFQPNNSEIQKTVRYFGDTSSGFPDLWYVGLW